MRERRMLTDLELTEIGATVAVEGLGQEIDELQAEIRRLQQENARLCVLIAYVDDASPLEWVKRVMSDNEAAQLWEQARTRGRTLVEKGEG